MTTPEPTILTKWGRLTGRQWIEARTREAMDDWWTPEVTAYVLQHWPTPEQIEVNRSARMQQRQAERRQARASSNRMRTAKSIADCARTDGYGRSGSGSRPRPAPSQLSIL